MVAKNESRDFQQRKYLTPLNGAGLAAAILLSITAIAIDTHFWAHWFSHPDQSRAELTQEGATLFRIMLAVTAIMLVVAPVVWMKFANGRPLDIDRNARSSKRQMWTLLGIVVFAIAARATRINESLWYDEIASWMTYAGRATTLGAVIGNFFDPINHPFHTLLNTLSVQWFTSTIGAEAAFRLPAMTFSLLAIIAMFGLVRSTMGDRAALIAAALTALLPVCVLEGVEARGYSMVIFFSAMMTLTFVLARSRKRPLIWMMYAIVCALGIWSHFVTAFVPIGHGVWMAWRALRYREWREAANATAALVLGAAFTITLYSPMIPAMLASRGMFAAVSDRQPTILGIEGFHALLQLGGSWYWWAALPGLGLLVIGLLSLIFVRREAASGSGGTAAHAVELAMIGLPLMVIAVALSGTWVYARFTFFALPGAILLIALGIDALWSQRRVFGFIAMGLVVIASIADLAIRPAKQPLRDAADYVRHYRQPDDRLLVIGLAHEVLRLYAHDLNLTYSFRHGVGLSQQLRSTQPQWVVIEYPNSVAAETYATLHRAGFQKITEFPGWVDWVNGDVLIYRQTIVR